MKTKLLTVFLICFFANLYTSQTMIKTANFNIKKAATILKAKGYEVIEEHESFIKIKNKEYSSLFIDLDQDKKYLFFNIKVVIKPGTSKDKIDKLLADINNLNMIKVKYIPEDNSIFFQYFYWIAESFTEESFTDAVLEFYLYQGDSYGLDKDKIFDYE